MQPENHIQEIVFEESPVKSWQVIGLLEDEIGNSFRLFLSATLKRDLDKFISQINKGEVQITVQVIPRERLQETSDSVVVSDNNALPDANMITGNVRIGISRLDMKVKPPYQIRYVIDPPISRPVAHMDRFQATFDDQDIADILCEVRQGRVEIGLEELNASGRTISGPLVQIASVGNPAVFHRSKTPGSIGNWLVWVRGERDNSYFVLKYDKQVF